MAESAWYSWAAGVPVTILEIDQASTALAGQADMGTVTLASPTANPAAISATVLSESGNLNGAYQYVMTETVGAIDGHGNLHPAGQTAAGTASNVVNASDNPIALSVPAPSALAISRTLWRTTGGGSTFYFLVTIVDPQVSTWTDNVADADLGTTIAPTVNTTGTVLQLPVFPAVPAFAAPAGVIVAVTVASGTTVLYRSNGSGWLPVPDLAVANTWTANQTFSGGVTVPTTATFTNSGTYAGSPLLTSLTAGTGVSVTNPTSPGTATVNVSDAPNTALAGPLVTSLTATDGLSVSNPTGVGTASYSVVLNGATLSNGTSGLSVNLDNANTWTAVQTLDSPVLSGTTTNSGTISGGELSGTTITLPATGAGTAIASPESPASFLDGYLNIHYPITGSGYVWRFFSESTVTFEVWGDGSNRVSTLNNTLDNGSGAATVAGLLTANGNLALPSVTPDTAAGVVSQSGNQLYIGNGSTANGVSTSAAGTWTPASGTFNVASGTVINVASVPVGAVNFKVIVGEGTTDANYIIGVTTTSGSAWVTAASDSSPLTGASAAISSTTTTNSPGGVWYDGSYSATGYFQINTGYLQLVVISSAASAVAVAPLNWGVS